MCFFFFFSSRRRHTRYWRDWSSDVCSSDLTTLVDELRLSLDYYAAQESAVAVGKILFCGPGSTIPGLCERMEEAIGLPIGIAHPPALSEYGEDEAARLTLPYGLALES